MADGAIHDTIMTNKYKSINTKLHELDVYNRKRYVKLMNQHNLCTQVAAACYHDKISATNILVG